MPRPVERVALTLFCLMPLLLAVTRAGADIALCAIGVLFLLHSAQTKDWGWAKRTDLRILALLWVYMMATSVLSGNPAAAFKTAAIWGRLLLFYAASTSWLLISPRNLITVCRAGIAILLLLVLDAGWQYITGTSLSGKGILFSAENGAQRLTGPLSNPNIGNLIFKTGIPVFGLVFYLVRDKSRLALSVIFAFITTALVLVSGERSSAILLLLGIAKIGSTTFIFRPQARKTVLIAGVALAALVASLWATQHVVQQRSHYFAEQLHDFRHTPYGQLYLAATDLWKSHPLIGIGAGQFSEECPLLMQTQGITYCDVHPHNMYFEWLADTGLIGIGLFLAAMVFVALRVSRFSMLRNARAGLPAAFACGTLAALLFPLIVTQSVFSNWPGILFWYSLGLAVSLPNIARESA